MTKSTWRSHNKMYESKLRKASSVLPGVSYEIRRISYAGRLELLKQVRELVGKREFYEASEKAPDRLEAEIVSREIRLSMLRWGLLSLDGLEIDGEPATVEDAIRRGPEALAEEAASAIEAQLSLSEEERKN
ncbi:MAG: hypothetical protein SFV51_08885 [Bryobacteraceae bacterium]|nr:hypothetical protein [Bryobacteraceae bacterium]